MSTKSYNMGRVVGWSTYEEFLKENPNIDPNKITSMVYSTMVTYGLTRIVTLPAEANKWQPTQGTETVFYTTTVEVPGATFGAVPVVGVNYDYYVREFKSSAHKYSDATEQAGANKELLEKAFSCIFTCYVSDVNGVRAESAVANSGYLTFAAHPDIVDYLEAVSALIAPETGLKVIVRGLSLAGFTNAEDLYFGPQGMVVTNGGSGSEDTYCDQNTVNISALCLNASGYIWMNNGGGVANSGEATLATLHGHPHGDVLISTFGYLNPDWINGTGEFENLGHYAFTYEQYLDVKNTPNFNINSTQVNAIPAGERNNYVYVIDGRASYTTPPPSSAQLYAIPVRKSDYYVNVGTFDNMLTPTLKKKLSLVSSCTKGSTTAIPVIMDTVTPNYLGSYWYADSVPTECKIVYWDSSSFTTDKWVGADLDSYDDVYYDEDGRNTQFSIKNAPFPDKGSYVVLYNQPLAKLNGLYQCVRDKYEDLSGYNKFVRIGAYLSIDIPSWVTTKSGNFCWKCELPANKTTVTNGVLYYDGSPVYPGELIVLGTSVNHKQYFVMNTVTGSSADLILNTECEFSLDISSTAASIGSGVTSAVDNKTTFVVVDTLVVEDVVTSKTISVYTSETAQTSFTLTNTTFSNGLLFNIRHQKENVYGYNKWYRYIYAGEYLGCALFASGELWTSNSNLSNVAGHPGTYNSAFPNYGQTLPTTDGSWHYNAPAALSGIPAKKMFVDFGLDIADYVHEDFQNISLGKFLQECVIRKDLSVAASETTMRHAGVESTFHLYSKEDLNYTSGNVPTPTAGSPIEASLILTASTGNKSYFSTAYYSATLKNGTPVNINNPEYPIWASISKSPEGTEIASVSVTDNSGSQLDFSGNSGTIEADTITWLDLLIGLGSGKSVDVLKGARFGKGNNNCNYIETADGTRLYISTTEPTGDIPEGSIGIGW